MKNHPHTAIDHVDDQLGVLPILILRFANVKRAAAGLVEHQIWPVLGFQEGDQLQRDAGRA